MTFGCNIFTFARLRLFMTFELIFVKIAFLNYEWMNACSLNYEFWFEWMNGCTYVWTNEGTKINRKQDNSYCLSILVRAQNQRDLTHASVKTSVT